MDPGFGAHPANLSFPVTLVTNQPIACMVVNSINTDSGVPSDSDITVDVEAGIVTFSGTVPTKFAKHRAGDDAWWLPDVIDVRNQLQVIPRRNRGQQRQQRLSRPQFLRQQQGQGMTTSGSVGLLTPIGSGRP